MTPPIILRFATLFVILLFIGFYPLKIAGEQLPSIHWNSNNEIFRIDNTDHIFTAKIRDTVEIHCPLYPDTVTQDQAEYSVIYAVSKRGYDECSLDDAKPIGQCLSPYKESIFKMTFREFTPTPGGIEFQPGKIYYFISTSTGMLNGLHNRVGGMCRSKNMRIKFEIIVDPNRLNYFLPNFDIAPTTSTSSSTPSSIEEISNSASAMEVYLQKLPTDKPSKMNIENSKFYRLLSTEEKEERRHLIDNSVSAFEIDARPQSDGRMVVKPLYLSYSGNDAALKTTSRPPLRPSTVVLYEVHEISDFDMQSVRSSVNGKNYCNICLIFTLLLVLTTVMWRFQS